MNITEKQLTCLLDALCCIANEDDEYIGAYKIAEETFYALDRGDGKNDFVFQCESCDQWFLREHFGKHGECFDCINQ